MPHDDQHGHGRDREIGGVPIEIYEDGHVKLDGDKIASDVAHRVDQKVSQTIFGCVFSVVFICAFVGLIIGSVLYVMHEWNKSPTGTATTVQKSGAAEGWTGATPLLCDGNDAMTVTGVTATLPGEVAVVAKANCQLTLVDCSIDAGTGIKASANAKVTIRGGSVKGSVAAIDASGLADVTARGVKLSGKRKTHGGAHVRERKK